MPACGTFFTRVRHHFYTVLLSTFGRSRTPQFPEIGPAISVRWKYLETTGIFLCAMHHRPTFECNEVINGRFRHRPLRRNRFGRPQKKKIKTISYRKRSRVSIGCPCSSCLACSGRDHSRGKKPSATTPTHRRYVSCDGCTVNTGRTTCTGKIFDTRPYARFGLETFWKQTPRTPRFRLLSWTLRMQITYKPGFNVKINKRYVHLPRTRYVKIPKPVYEQMFF